MATETPDQMSGECDHGQDLAWCTICRERLGFRPGGSTFEADCGVRSFVRLTGAEYGEAVQILAGHGFRPSHGTPKDGIVQALRATGFAATAFSSDIRSAVADGGTFLVSSSRGRKGHAWTIRYGEIEEAGRFLLPGTRYQIWRVS